MRNRPNLPRDLLNHSVVFGDPFGCVRAQPIPFGLHKAVVHAYSSQQLAYAVVQLPSDTLRSSSCSLIMLSFSISNCRDLRYSSANTLTFALSDRERRELKCSRLLRVHIL